MKMSKAILSVAAVLTAAMLLLTGCGGRTLYKVGKVFPYTDTLTSEYSSADLGGAYTYSDYDTKLYYDKRTFSPAIGIGEGTKIWSALPLSDNTAASVFTITAIYEGKLYTLDSQKHAVALSGVTMAASGKTVTAKYTLSPADRAFSIMLSLEFTMGAYSLTVSTDTDDWQYPDDVLITGFSLLPFFGAVKYESYGINMFSDYFCVPDGSGAVLYTKYQANDVSDREYDVYSGTVTAPVFGVKQDDSAFACVTVAGDSCEKIVTGIRDGFSTVYSRFELAESNNDGSGYVKAYSGRICNVYSFLEGTRMSFADISAAARSVLLEYGFLTDSSDGNSHTVVKIDCTDENGNVITDTDDVQSILGLLKGKGIDNVSLILGGILREESSGSTPVVVSDAGGEKGVSELVAFARVQGAEVYASSFVRTSSSKASSLKDASKNAVTIGDRYLIGAGKTSACISALSRSSVFDGFFIEDASADIVSASNLSGSSSGEIRSAISGGLEKLSGDRKIITAGGYFCTLPGASAAVSVPLEPSMETSAYYVAEPFIPAILHGCTGYTGEAVNTQEIPTLAMLKAIEYGCSACVEWNGDGTRQNYYENGLSDFSDFMYTVSEELGDLSDLEITDHYMVADGVSCTEYDRKTLVYVNFNNYSVDIGDVIVLPYDYVRLN